MFSRLGRLVAAHPWRVIAVWVAAAAVIVPLSPSLADVTNPDQASFLPDSYESAQAQELAERAFPRESGATALFVLERADGGRLTGADRREIGELAAALGRAGIPRVTAVRTSEEQIAPNGKLQLVQVAFRGLPVDDPVLEAVAPLRERASELLDGSGLRADLTGETAIFHDSQEAFESADVIVAVATIGLIIFLLGVIFRSPFAALLPIVSVGLVFALSTSLVALAADTFGFELGSEVTSLLIVVLFGIGTDYILFLLFRFRERLRAGDEGRRAVSFSVARVGEAIASSALVVMAAFLALGLSEFGSFRSIAPAFVVSIGVMLLAAVTLIPAILALTGPRIFWPSKNWRAEPEHKLGKRLGGLIARRPGRVAAASGAGLVALGLGLAFYQADYDTAGALPDDTEAAQGFETLKQAFPAGALNPTHVYVSDEQPLPRAELAQLAERLRRVDGVAGVTPPELNADRTAAQIAVLLEASPSSTEALDLVEGPLREAAHASPAGERVLVGGQTSAFSDIRDAVNRDYRLVFPVAAALIALILGLLLRSVVAPLYLLLGVVLTFAATLGASVALFQGAAGENGLIFMLPIMVYLFVVAIGTDYNILVTTRLREEFKEGHPPRRAADLAVEHAGPTVAAAGLILAGTFGSLVLTGVGLLAQMGFAIGVGIAIAAFLMATVFVPSLAALIGRWIWWPGHQGDVERAEAAPVALPAAADGSEEHERQVATGRR